MKLKIFLMKSIKKVRGEGFHPISMSMSISISILYINNDICNTKCIIHKIDVFFLCDSIGRLNSDDDGNYWTAQTMVANRIRIRGVK